jgi:hypothetical protein
MKNGNCPPLYSSVQGLYIGSTLVHRKDYKGGVPLIQGATIPERITGAACR